MSDLKGNIRKLSIVIGIPFLSILIVLTDESLYEVIIASILTIFAIYMALTGGNNSKEIISDYADDELVKPEVKPEVKPVEPKSQYTGEEDEGFSIVNPPEKIEIKTTGYYSHADKKLNFSEIPDDIKEEFYSVINEKLPEVDEPGAQLSFLINKLLAILKDAYLCHSAVFFIYRNDKKILSLKNFDSNSNDIAKIDFPLSDDLVSKVIDSQSPHFIGVIDQADEQKQIRYYSRNIGIKSFIGVPLFFGKSIKGVLALDSRAEDHFGFETIFSLGKVVRVISLLLNIFDSHIGSVKYENRLRALLDFIGPETEYENDAALYSALGNAVTQLIKWDNHALVMFDNQDKAFRVIHTISKDGKEYIRNGSVIEMERSIVGRAILDGSPVRIDDLSKKTTVLFREKENIVLQGSFMAIPLVYETRNFGVLCFSNNNPQGFSSEEENFIMRCARILSYIVYMQSTRNLIKSYISVDLETQILHKFSFEELVRADIKKAQQTDTPASFSLILLDEFEEEENLFGSNNHAELIRKLKDRIKELLPEMATFGRIDKHLFGIFFFNMKSTDVHMWAEKLRVQQASDVLPVLTSQNTFTISVGIAPLTDGQQYEDIFKNAMNALEKASQKGNTIQISN